MNRENRPKRIDLPPRGPGWHSQAEQTMTSHQRHPPATSPANSPSVHGILGPTGQYMTQHGPSSPQPQAGRGSPGNHLQHGLFDQGMVQQQQYAHQPPTFIQHNDYVGMPYTGSTHGTLPSSHVPRQPQQGFLPLQPHLASLNLWNNQTVAYYRSHPEYSSPVSDTSTPPDHPQEMLNMMRQHQIPGYKPDQVALHHHPSGVVQNAQRAGTPDSPRMARPILRKEPTPNQLPAFVSRSGGPSSSSAASTMLPTLMPSAPNSPPASTSGSSHVVPLAGSSASAAVLHAEQRVPTAGAESTCPDRRNSKRYKCLIHHKDSPYDRKALLICQTCKTPQGAPYRFNGTKEMRKHFKTVHDEFGCFCHHANCQIVCADPDLLKGHYTNMHGEVSTADLENAEPLGWGKRGVKVSLSIERPM